MVRSSIKKVFHCDREKLWDIITNNSDYHWRTDLSNIKIVDDTHFIEYDKNNYPTYFTITSKEKLKVYEFDIENTNIKGKWIGKLKELEGGVIEIEFIEEVKTNHFIMRLLAKLYLKNMQKRYIKDLERELSKR